MASILQNLFVRALNPESVRSLKIVMSHASLYLGIILYTAVGAKVVQLLYFGSDIILSKQHIVQWHKGDSGVGDIWVPPGRFGVFRPLGDGSGGGGGGGGGVKSISCKTQT